MAENTTAPADELLVTGRDILAHTQLAQQFAARIVGNLTGTAEKLGEGDIAGAAIALINAVRMLSVFGALTTWVEAVTILGKDGPVTSAKLAGALAQMLTVTTLAAKSNDPFATVYNQSVSLVLAAEMQALQGKIAKAELQDKVAAANGITRAQLIAGNSSGDMGHQYLQVAYDKGVELPQGLIEAFNLKTNPTQGDAVDPTEDADGAGFGATKETIVTQPGSGTGGLEPLPVGFGSPYPGSQPRSTGVPTTGMNGGYAN